MDADRSGAVSEPVLGGGSASPEQGAHAREVLAASARQLSDVRAAAGRWQAGLGGLAGGITVFSLLKGRDDIDKLADPWAVIYGLLLAAALALAMLGSVLAMRAAFGLPRVIRTAAWRPGTSDIADSRAAARLLRAAIGLTLGSTAAVAATVAVAWYAPQKQAGPQLEIRQRSGVEACGSVIRVGAGVVVLKTETGEQRIPLATLAGVAAVRSCRGG